MATTLPRNLALGVKGNTYASSIETLQRWILLLLLAFELWLLRDSVCEWKRLNMFLHRAWQLLLDISLAVWKRNGRFQRHRHLRCLKQFSFQSSRHGVTLHFGTLFKLVAAPLFRLGSKVQVQVVLFDVETFQDLHEIGRSRPTAILQATLLVKKGLQLWSTLSLEQREHKKRTKQKHTATQLYIYIDIYFINVYNVNKFTLES